MEREEGCICPELHAGSLATGVRNLSSACPIHGEGTEYWRQYWQLRKVDNEPE